MTHWMTQLSEGVRLLFPRVSALALSADHNHMAFWRTREASTDSLAGERVYVLELSTGREIAAFDCRDRVRALCFAGDDSLLIQRDFAGSAWLGQHALPDGGVLAETRLGKAWTLDTDLQLSADARTVYSAPLWSERGQDTQHGVMLSLPELGIIQSIDPYDPELGAALKGAVARRSRLDPEGTQVIVTYSRQYGSGALALHDLSSLRTRRRRLVERSRDDLRSGVRWLSQTSVLVGDEIRLSACCGIDLHEPETRSDPRAAGVSFAAFGESLDRDRQRMIGPKLAIIDPRSGAGRSRIDLPFDVRSACFSYDGGHMVVMVSEPTRARVCALSLKGEVFGELKLPPQASAHSLRALRDGTVVLTPPENDYVRCRFIDPEALGLPRKA